MWVRPSDFEFVLWVYGGVLQFCSLGSSAMYNVTILFSCLILVCSCSSNEVGYDEITTGLPLEGSSVAESRDHRDSYQVKRGDTLDIFVLEDKGFNGSFQVRETGEIIIPQLGRIYVVGMGLAQVESAVKRQLEASQLREATVIADPSANAIQEANSNFGLAIRVTGRVSTTGRINVPQLGNSPVTAYQAVTEAGGLLPFADRKRSYVLRSNGLQVSKIPLNLEKIESGEQPDVPLLEGDTVVVPQKTLGF